MAIEVLAKAVVKDVKVTGKGIQIVLERVNLSAAQLAQAGALVQAKVHVTLEPVDAEGAAAAQMAAADVHQQLSFDDVEDINKDLGYRPEEQPGLVQSAEDEDLELSIEVE